MKVSTNFKEVPKLNFYFLMFFIEHSYVGVLKLVMIVIGLVNCSSQHSHFMLHISHNFFSFDTVIYSIMLSSVMLDIAYRLEQSSSFCFIPVFCNHCPP